MMTHLCRRRDIIWGLRATYYIMEINVQERKSALPRDEKFHLALYQHVYYIYSIKS